MGAVYLARQTMLGNREVALKEINFDAFPLEHREQALAQFRREAEVLAGLSHRNLVHVNDAFEENDRVYLAMNFIESKNLEELVNQQRRLPIDLMKDWAFQICDVLEYLHTRLPPIIFRDLKPGNIMLAEHGSLFLIGG